MKYYRFDLSSESGVTYEHFQSAPDNITYQQYFDIVHNCFTNVSNFKEISKSTFYRIQRQDAKKFWENLEERMFKETA